MIWLDRVDGAEGVRDVGDGHHAGARIEQLFVLLHEEFAALVHGNDAQFGVLLFAEHLPGDDVGVVLHRRDDDLVAGLHVLAAPGTADQVDAFGGAADEDQFIFAARIQKALGLGAGFLVGGGGALGELVNAAVDVGAVHFVEAADGIDHRERLLGGGGAIQIHQRLAVDVLLEDREILPDPLHVKIGRERPYLFTQRAHEISRTESVPANPVKTAL